MTNSVTTEIAEIVVCNSHGRKFRFRGKAAVLVDQLIREDRRGVRSLDLPEDFGPKPIVDRLNRVGIVVHADSGLQDDETGQFYSKYSLRTVLVVWSKKTADEIEAPDEVADEPEPADHGERVLAVLRRGWRIVEAPNGFCLQKVVDGADGPRWVDAGPEVANGDDMLRLAFNAIGPISDHEAATCRSIEIRRDAKPGYVVELGQREIIDDLDFDEEPEPEPEPEPEAPLVPGRPPVDPFEDSDADGIEPAAPKKKRARPKAARV